MKRATLILLALAFVGCERALAPTSYVKNWVPMKLKEGGCKNIEEIDGQYKADCPAATIFKMAEYYVPASMVRSK